jgi:hypothetical protein
MISEDDALPIDELSASCSPNLVRRLIELPALGVLTDDVPNWQTAILFVTAGEVALECAGGARARFHEGDMLSFAPFPGAIVRNVGSVPARLVAVWPR